MIKDNFYNQVERNQVIQENLNKVKYELTRTSKWNRSSEALEWKNQNYNKNKTGIGYYKRLSKIDPKYIASASSKLCTHCGNIGHYKKTCSTIQRTK